MSEAVFGGVTGTVLGTLGVGVVTLGAVGTLGVGVTGVP